MLTLKKHLTFTTALPAWMYLNPCEIVERIEAAAHKAKREREHKHRRIATLTRKALSK